MSNVHTFKHLAVHENGFVFDTATGATFTANGTAITILHAMQASKTKAEILNILIETYDRTPDDLARDLNDFMRMLAANGLTPRDYQLN